MSRTGGANRKARVAEEDDLSADVRGAARALRGTPPLPVAAPTRPAWVLPLAAVIALGLLTPLVYRSLTPAPPPVDTVRGTDVQPIAPIGPVAELREFSWQSPIEAVQYRVRVF